MNDLGKGRILVTGGAGFIGSALIWELNRRGYQNILVTDLLHQDEKWKNLVALRFSDYLEADELERKLSESRSISTTSKPSFTWVPVQQPRSVMRPT